MNVAIGILLFLIFLFLSGIHFYWGVGGKWGSEITVPTNEHHQRVLQPKLAACFAVGFVLLLIGLFVLVKCGLIIFPLPHWIANYGLWIIASGFILRAIGEFKYVGFFKKIKHTRFAQADTRFYSPLCLLIGILMILLN